MFNNHSGLKKIASPARRQASGPLFILRNVFGLIALVSITYALAGCGASVVAGKGLDSQGVFTASPNSVNFGSVNVGTSANNTVSLVNSSSHPVIVSSLSISGDSSFALDSQVQLPFTLDAGSTTALKVSYVPTGAATDSGNLIISSNSMIVPTATVRLQGQGMKPVNSNPLPVLSAFSCISGSLIGAGPDACSVTLNSAAPDGGFSVGLASSSATVSIPAVVTVPANATTVGFSATASAVASAQSATLTASAGGATKTFALQLQPASSPTAPNLTLSAASLPFGDVALNTPARQTLTLTSSGSSPLTISAATLTGAGFTMSGATFPVTLNPGQAASLTVEFDPTSAGTASGQIAVASDGGNATVALSGTGTKTSTPTLSLSAASLSFGSVALDTPAKQTLTLSSSGSGALTISAARLSGSGFTMSGATFPITLNPGQTASLTVQFDPTSAGAASGQIAITSNSSTGDNATVALSGTGTKTSIPTLSLSAASLSFGNVVLNTPATQTLTLRSSGSGALTISAARLSGSSFTMSGATFPITLNPGQTASLTIQFDPTSAGAASGQIAVTSNSSTGGSTNVDLSGRGTAAPSTAALSALSCTSGSMTGAGTDTCTVTMTAPAPSSGLNVTLASNNKAVTLPASINVPANATSAGFSATVSAVSSAQSATLTATANGVTKNFALQLGTAGGATLSINATSISFGSVSLNTPSTQSVTLTATGSSAVAVSSASITGTGFSLPGAKFPMTVNPGTPATLSVQFDPTASGTATGQLVIANNSTNDANPSIGLSGTGAALQIALNWDAPSSSSDPIAGYNVYRAVSGSSSYSVVKSGNSQTSFTDSTIKSGTTYQYYVTSLDSTGAESTPSNTATVAVP
jgi:Abnormal spindle-like microcephaly-assoc'd, ASPM-SPD-2-Hydin